MKFPRQEADFGGFKYCFDIKGKLLALGRYPEVSMKDARERREEAKKLLAHGIDPGETKKARKAARSDRARILSRWSPEND